VNKSSIRMAIENISRLTAESLFRRCLLVLCVMTISGCDLEAENVAYDTVLGPSIVSSSLVGRWQVINYWATWCGPCITEIPELNELAEDRADSLVVLGVDFDAPAAPAVARASIEKMVIDFPVLASDPSARWGLSMPEVLPTTVLINPKGELHQILVGPQTKTSILGAMVARSISSE
jgi:thiol-disulfide isomerase/thioredoxin